jgi:hypothetical protein
MRAIHAILRAAKAILAAAGLTKYAVEAEVADVALTTVEQVVAQVKTHAADGATTIFLSAPDMSSALFRQYVDSLRDTFRAEREKSGVTLPHIVLLPPGMTLEVVKEAADQLAHAAEYLATQKDQA